MATYQRLIPNEIYGRIHGTRRTLVWGLMPVGAFMGGFIARMNLRAPWLIGGTIATLVAINNFLFIRKIGDEVVNPEFKKQD